MKKLLQHLRLTPSAMARQWVIVFLFLLSCTADAQKEDDTIRALASDLKAKKISAEQALTNTQYLSLHYDDGFRKLIREHAPTGKITIVAPSEQGQRIVIRGVMLATKDKSPLTNQLFYFYHTMNNGYYGENTEKSKLFGYVKTDNKGMFEIHTIRPGGYPGEKFPSHVHVEVYGSGGQAIFGTEFQFADDPRIDKVMEETSLRHGNLISKNLGSADKPVYDYKVEVPSP